MTTVAVIIARSGSKGLENKSMQLLAGKPLIAWTIEHALGSQAVDHVVLSSDCPQIRSVAARYGIIRYERPADRSTDSTTIDDGARHGIECWEAQFNAMCDYAVILYGNVPLRPVNLTDLAMKKMIETEADSVQSVCPVGKMHPFWMKKLAGPTEDVLQMYEDNCIYRRQDLPPIYMPDGGVIAVTRKNLFNVDPADPHAFLGNDRRAIKTQPGQVVDVDDRVDLALAAAVLKVLYTDFVAEPPPGSAWSERFAGRAVG